MPKSRKRKLPVTSSLSSNHHDLSAKPISGHHLIRKFHVLLKRQDQLLKGSSTSHELEEVQREIESLGGLEAYQQMSARGQSEERGGGSEKIFVGWLMKMGENERRVGNSKDRLALLEVGAVKPGNYAHATWIQCTSIDLRSRHPLIQEQNFLEMDVETNCSVWDAISLSLVVNFVPNAKDRGKMLSLSHLFLREGGYLFLALPLPCVANSRYIDFDHLRGLMSAVGFNLVKERWKPGGKMGYWLYQKVNATFPRGEDLDSRDARRRYEKKAILKEGSGRNNFVILL